MKLLNIAIAIDQVLNTIAGGYPDETLSSRAHRRRKAGSRGWTWFANAVDKLFFWQHAHCFEAYESERLRLQQPPELRETLQKM